MSVSKKKLINYLKHFKVSELREITKYLGQNVTKQSGGYYNKPQMIYNLVGGMDPELQEKLRLRRALQGEGPLPAASPVHREGSMSPDDATKAITAGHVSRLLADLRNTLESAREAHKQAKIDGKVGAIAATAAAVHAAEVKFAVGEASLTQAQAAQQNLSSREPSSSAASGSSSAARPASAPAKPHASCCWKVPGTSTT
jgi:type II secretory pathway component HofQ